MQNWQIGFVALLLLLSFAVSVLLTIIVLRKRDAPGALPFVGMVIGIGIWSLAYAFELFAPSLEGKIFWAKIQYIGISVVPVGWFLFVQEYSGNDRWSGKKAAGLLMLIPITTVLVAFTNSMHGYLWNRVALIDQGSVNLLAIERYGIWWWVFFVYSYGLLAWGTYRILWSFRFKGGSFRGQLNLILIGVAIPWLSNLLYLIRIPVFHWLDFSPIVFCISAVLIAIAIYRFRLFDLIPVMTPIAIHHLDSPAFILDTRSRIVDLNEGAKTLLDQKDADPIGVYISDACRWWSMLSEDLQQSDEANLEHPIVIDGLRRYVNIAIHPVGNFRNRSAARMVILRDITGEKLAREAIALAQVKTEFLAKVGHELRSPLTGILGIAEMLDYGVYGSLSEEQHKAVQMISESTKHMTRMVNDLLQQSKMERGTFRFDISVFSVRELIQRVTAHFEPLSKMKGLDLSLEIDPEVPEKIENDSLRLYQILVNLTDNAIKYTLKGGIRLRVFLPDADHLAFQVTDTGVGIPKDIQRLVFNPFQRANDAPDQKESGFGLGLSIVKQLVSLMDGEIEMESEVGKGSSFTVILPLKPDWDSRQL